MAKKTPIEYCSFCGRTADDTLLMITSEEARICNYCIEQAYGILHQQIAAHTPKEEATANGDITLKKPQEIKAFLDQYVIGQDLPKRYSQWRSTTTTSAWHSLKATTMSRSKRAM